MQSMKVSSRFFLFRYLFVTILFFAADAFAGGSWGSSGGGSGVACFSNLAIAAKAEEYLKENKPLPLEVRDQIQELVALDFWEWRLAKPFELFSPQSQNYKDIIKEVDQRVSEVAPIYIFRLRQAAHLIEMVDWENKMDIPKINDIHLTTELPKNCKLVQLVVRYHRDNYENMKGEGPSSKIPEVKIEFDKNLFDRLNPLNQAILVFHEQMYLMAQTIGHQNSDELRPLVMRFFEKDLHNAEPTDGQNFYIRPNLVYYFGDYILYFEDISLLAQPFTQESRFNSFIEMLKVIRDKIGQCLKTSKVSDQDCQDIAMHPVENQKWLTDEMAFVYYNYFILDRTRNLINSEMLLAPLKEGSFVTESQRLLKASCNFFASDEFPQIVRVIGKKAQTYCSNLRLQIPRK